MQKQRIYLAYGSNINRNQMAKRCPFAKVLGTGFIEGQELQFKGAATIAPKKNARTPVLAWSLTEFDESSLDVYEGYPKCYVKENFSVEIKGKPVVGMAYVMTNKLKPQYTPLQSYYNCIAEGYIKSGMDMVYLKNALKRAMHEHETRKTFYIAYGSNINHKQMAERCPDAVPIAKGELPGYELQFRQYATISPLENSSVPVLIWKISCKDEMNLDRYEGFPGFYRKEFLEYNHGGKNAAAMAYVMNGNDRLAAPSKHYYSGILEGYRKFGLDESVLETAQQKAFEAERECRLKRYANELPGFGQLKL